MIFNEFIFYEKGQINKAKNKGMNIKKVLGNFVYFKNLK